jgi:hypothetical protein
MNTTRIFRKVTAVPKSASIIRSADPGGAALENHARVAYQSAHTRDGRVPPLPLTLADAWAEAALINPGRYGDFNAS